MTVKLVTKADETAAGIVERMTKLLEKVKEHPHIGMAMVLIRHDGATFVSTISNGNRVLLLGAVADLQYTIAKHGG